MYTSPTHSGYLVRDTIFQDNGFGIHLGTSGKHPTLVCRNRFTANNEFEGPAGANGIYSDEGAQQVLITSNLFEGHNGAADLLRRQGHSSQRDVLIEHNKSVDDLSFATIFNSTRVRVTSNWIKARVGDPQFPGPASAIFIGARNDDIVVQKNKIKSASGNGIDITNTGRARHRPGAAHERGRAQEQGRARPAVRHRGLGHGAGEYQVLHNRSLTNERQRHPLRPRHHRRHRHRQHRPRQRGRLQGRVDRAQEHLDRQRRRTPPSPPSSASPPPSTTTPTTTARTTTRSTRRAPQEDTRSSTARTRAQCTLPWRF